jgi:hypothetical protein
MSDLDLPPTTTRTNQEHKNDQQPIVPELVKLEGNINAAPEITAILVTWTHIVLGLAIQFEGAIFVGVHLGNIICRP